MHRRWARAAPPGRPFFGLLLLVSLGSCAPQPQPSVVEVPTPTQAIIDPDAPWTEGAATVTGWTEAPIAAASHVVGIVDTAAGLLAYGSQAAGFAGPAGVPAVWLRDGSGHWTATPLPVARGQEAETPTVAVAARSIIALAGAGETGLCAHPYGGTGWGNGGHGWVQSPALPEDCTRTPAGLAHGDAGFVEVTAATGEVYGLWRSDDGVRWTEVALPTGLAPDAQLFGIAALPGRYLVAGRVSGRPTAWSSTDAASWTTIALPGDADAPLVVAGAGRFAVIAATGGSVVGTWVLTTTGDGAVPQVADPSLAGASATTASGTADALIVAGTSGGLPSAWLSTDGVHWSRETIAAGPGSVASVTVSGGRIWAIGTTTDAAGNERAVAWSHAWPIATGG